jgi:transposase
MILEMLQTHWAAWMALALLLFAAGMITPQLLEKTSRSKLNRVLGNMKEARKELRKAHRGKDKAEKKFRKLLARGDRVKPRILEEAREAVDDGRSLAKIMSDKLMVAETHVRRIILDEYPPAEHDRLREKYLAPDLEDTRPFSF